MKNNSAKHAFVQPDRPIMCVRHLSSQTSINFRMIPWSMKIDRVWTKTWLSPNANLRKPSTSTDLLLFSNVVLHFLTKSELNLYRTRTSRVILRKSLSWHVFVDFQSNEIFHGKSGFVSWSNYCPEPSCQVSERSYDQFLRKTQGQTNGRTSGRTDVGQSIIGPASYVGWFKTPKIRTGQRTDMGRTSS